MREEAQPQVSDPKARKYGTFHTVAPWQRRHVLSGKIPVEAMPKKEQLNNHSPVARAPRRELNEPVAISDCDRAVKNLALPVNRERCLNQHAGRTFQVQRHVAIGGLFVSVGVKLQREPADSAARKWRAVQTVAAAILGIS